MMHFTDHLITQSLSDKDINRIESAKTLHDTRWPDVNDVKYQEKLLLCCEKQFLHIVNHVRQMGLIMT